MTDIVERLRAECTDWDGSKMDARTEPMPTMRCGLLYEAADEIERLRLDAARYRWLRDSADADNEQPYVTIHKINDWGKWFNTWECGEGLDAAIDAAMKG